MQLGRISVEIVMLRVRNTQSYAQSVSEFPSAIDGAQFYALGTGVSILADTPRCTPTQLQSIRVFNPPKLTFQHQRSIIVRNYPVEV